MVQADSFLCGAIVTGRHIGNQSHACGLQVMHLHLAAHRKGTELMPTPVKRQTYESIGHPEQRLREWTMKAGIIVEGLGTG